MTRCSPQRVKHDGCVIEQEMTTTDPYPPFLTHNLLPDPVNASPNSPYTITAMAAIVVFPAASSISSSLTRGAVEIYPSLPSHSCSFCLNSPLSCLRDLMSFDEDTPLTLSSDEGTTGPGFSSTCAGITVMKLFDTS
ncbi:hypothetical protein B0O80DRAFT_139715 [Mortierella sp. GBAus27b]|nr:hypothetical protein B0O80DRAFT_139715 [Mortierella sp. GBAus27b]